MFLFTLISAVAPTEVFHVLFLSIDQELISRVQQSVRSGGADNEAIGTLEVEHEQPLGDQVDVAQGAVRQPAARLNAQVVDRITLVHAQQRFVVVQLEQRDPREELLQHAVELAIEKATDREHQQHDQARDRHEQPHEQVGVLVCLAKAQDQRRKRREQPGVPQQHQHLDDAPPRGMGDDRLGFGRRKASPRERRQRLERRHVQGHSRHRQGDGTGADRKDRHQDDD